MARRAHQSPEPKERDMKRRTFVKGLGAAALSTAVAGTGRTSYAANANENLVIGVMGCSRGLTVCKDFLQKGTRVAYVCDPDEERRNRAKDITNAGKAVADFREILDDAAVDAVVIAPTDHWHGPMAIMACEAGKHVYVEKPCAHNIREGRLMIEAARRANRVMQVGSQSRSTQVLKNGIQLVREGAIGDVLIAKAWNSQKRADIGHAESSEPPAGFDYDLWVGPAPMRAYQSNCHHYTWHWWYDFGTGDAGNDGVHELDIALWALGVETHPSKVSGYGAKMFFEDDQQFPDSQYVTFEYPQAGGKLKSLVYEHRIWTPYTQQGFENANAFYGTNGYMILAKGRGWRMFGPKDELLKEEQGGFSVPEHIDDFVNAIRAGGRPSADIEIGHRAATLAHLANILARTGKGSFRFDPENERFVDDPEANAMVSRTYREGHWAVPQGV